MNRLERFADWRRRHAMPFDVLLGVALFALFVAVGSSVSDAPGLFMYFDNIQQMLWSLAMLVPMLTRRTWPQASAWGCVALSALQLVVGPSLVFGDFFVLILLYTVIVYGNPANTKVFVIAAYAMGALSTTIIAWTLLAGPIPAALSLNGQSNVTVCGSVYTQGFSSDCAHELMSFGLGLFSGTMVILTSVIVMAYWSRARIYTVRLMQERNDSILMREEEERHIAALAERARIARDMHDVVAHTLSIIIIQSDGGRYAGTHDPALARHTMETIRHESERASHDMKRLFGVFDEITHDEYTDIGTLVEQARAASSDEAITRSILGTPLPERLSQPARIAFYRLVQEALTNVRKYAGPHASVGFIEEWSKSGVRISITDNGRGKAAAADGHTPGYGLMGMKERVAAAHGTVSAAPRPEGGFAVDAFLPYAHDLETDDLSQVSGGTVEGLTLPAHRSRASAWMPSPSSAVQAPAWWGRWRDLMAFLRQSQVRRPGAVPGVRFNWIERISQWTQRHYLISDIAAAALFMAVMTSATYGDGNVFGTSIGNSDALNRLITVAILTPLAFRRRFPETSAAFVAAMSGLQLFFLPEVLTVNVFALVSLYSVMLYGREKAWRWVSLAALANVALLSCRIVADQRGYHTTFEMFAGIPDPTATSGTSPATGAAIIIVFTVAVMCLGVVAAARWARSSGSNALVLQTREEALRAEQEKEKVLAANMERNRIGARIQTEVSETLASVIDTADAGLRLLNDSDRRGRTPSPETIASAFEMIGRQGRSALSHMRELLGILRETGFSDAPPHAGEQPQLHPASSLDHQLESAQRPNTDTGTGTGAEQASPR